MRGLPAEAVRHGNIKINSIAMKSMREERRLRVFENRVLGRILGLRGTR
jgi:hypothetical protein